MTDRSFTVVAGIEPNLLMQLTRLLRLHEQFPSKFMMVEDHAEKGSIYHFTVDCTVWDCRFLQAAIGVLTGVVVVHVTPQCCSADMAGLPAGSAQ